ncbi:DUF2789 domain-containing protein [Pseudomonas sp. S75]|uniref:DUF2789 domain-containing protein n=1 Tax=unclassified Pseudomonas TaxID=196821 RepID=UPI001902CC2F|nr:MULTISPECIES: DUF2789 domain-containing protein [unclassified Pseudomonas]MBJ9974136.1 DUF2789 domain-containing protein [Pseudomonas sp. S30]MBK0151934.1 DUF2789 domain-containing protein [Pseudomonas sp. S75]
MNKPVPRMTNLFLQLGLPADEASIAQFIGTHQLPSGVEFTEAPYWSDAQRQFLSEQIKADATWAIVVDQLNESLHEEAVQGGGRLSS